MITHSKDAGVRTMASSMPGIEPARSPRNDSCSALPSAVSISGLGSTCAMQHLYFGSPRLRCRAPLAPRCAAHATPPAAGCPAESVSTRRRPAAAAGEERGEASHVVATVAGGASGAARASASMAYRLLKPVTAVGLPLNFCVCVRCAHFSLLTVSGTIVTEMSTSKQARASQASWRVLFCMKSLCPYTYVPL